MTLERSRAGRNDRLAGTGHLAAEPGPARDKPDGSSTKRSFGRPPGFGSPGFGYLDGMTNNGDLTKPPTLIVCGAPFTRDDGSRGTCALLDGHRNDHTDVVAPWVAQKR